MLSGKKILLTGGAGFIGAALCCELYNDNKLFIYDNFRRNSIEKTGLAGHKHISIIKGDVLDFESLNKCIRDCKPDIVIHLAAVAGIDNVIRNPLLTMKVNMIGTYNLLEALKEYSFHIERLVIFSTSEVFGTMAYKVDEKSSNNLAPVGEARWTYSISKLAGEHLAFSYYKEYGIPTVTVRPFNVYGPGQVGEGAIHTFIERALRNEQLQIHGDGDQIRAWCYIDDFVRGVLLCLEKDEAVGNSFNIGNPRESVTISMLAQIIKRIASSQSEIVHVPKNYVDVELRIPSIEKARRILGFEPVWDLTHGLEKTVEWYRSVMND